MFTHYLAHYGQCGTVPLTHVAVGIDVRPDKYSTRIP
jgi:hypothetical protein